MPPFRKKTPIAEPATESEPPPSVEPTPADPDAELAEAEAALDRLALERQQIEAELIGCRDRRQDLVENGGAVSDIIAVEEAGRALGVQLELLRPRQTAAQQAVTEARAAAMRAAWAARRPVLAAAEADLAAAIGDLRAALTRYRELHGRSHGFGAALREFITPPAAMMEWPLTEFVRAVAARGAAPPAQPSGPVAPQVTAAITAWGRARDRFMPRTVPTSIALNANPLEQRRVTILHSVSCNHLIGRAKVFAGENLLLTAREAALLVYSGAAEYAEGAALAEGAAAPAEGAAPAQGAAPADQPAGAPAPAPAA